MADNYDATFDNLVFDEDLEHILEEIFDEAQLTVCEDDNGLNEDVQRGVAVGTELRHEPANVTTSALSHTECSDEQLHTPTIHANARTVVIGPLHATNVWLQTGRKTHEAARTGNERLAVHQSFKDFREQRHGTTTGPLRTTARPQAPPPLVHETTICPFDHYSDGKTTGPLDHRPTPGPTPRSTKPLFVHLTIIVTERPRDPCGPPPRPQAPPPQVHKTTICPFDHYSDGKTTGPLRTGPPPLVHETTICPLDHYSHGTTTGPLRTTAPTPCPTPPGPRNHYLSI
ncbi:hypothetical protein G5714_016446 [Onychostoma macrolepis]|uniref:Uncharacterized protein n=1 Tax=Onychostoma macrolepis TaxID=369639 RepID=A0A7J6CA72_9TELE|nr:hypothetical protein G5714_016446 [Onychostoma macrolepis]